MVVIAALLWIVPSLIFQRPGTNDAIFLSDFELPLLLVALLGLVIAVAVFRGHAAVVTRVGLGVFLMGAAAGLVVGLAVFGNLTNDRFAPLLFLPIPVGLAGLAALAVGLAGSRLRLPEVIRGAVYGAIGAVVVAIWILLRGGRDWLLAPYGFDVVALIIVVGVAVVLASLQVRSSATGG